MSNMGNYGLISLTGCSWIWFITMLNFGFHMLQGIATMLVKDALQKATSLIRKFSSCGPMTSRRRGGIIAYENQHSVIPILYHNGCFVVGGG